jgi:hypothetical protein
MLEYTKTILQKVSFNPPLFAKELKKSLKWLKGEEISALKIWCMLTFGDVYPEVIQDTFKSIKVYQ